MTTDTRPVECKECGMLTAPVFNPCLTCREKPNRKASKNEERFLIAVGIGGLAALAYKMAGGLWRVVESFNVEDHPYLSLYLLGCALVVVLTLANVTLHWCLAWVTKANIVAGNLKKLKPPVHVSFLVKVGKFLGTIILESLLSWLNVLVI